MKPKNYIYVRRLQHFYLNNLICVKTNGWSIIDDNNKKKFKYYNKYHFANLLMEGSVFMRLWAVFRFWLWLGYILDWKCVYSPQKHIPQREQSFTNTLHYIYIYMFDASWVTIHAIVACSYWPQNIFNTHIWIYIHMCVTEKCVVVDPIQQAYSYCEIKAIELCVHERAATSFSSLSSTVSKKGDAMLYTRDQSAGHKGGNMYIYISV